jgi:hypothetical protein
LKRQVNKRSKTRFLKAAGFGAVPSSTTWDIINNMGRVLAAE